MPILPKTTPFHFARTIKKESKVIMFIQSKAATSNAHKNGLCIAQRRGGRETLVQWSNGDQQWCITEDLVGRVVLLGDATHNG